MVLWISGENRGEWGYLCIPLSTFAEEILQSVVAIKLHNDPFSIKKGMFGAMTTISKNGNDLKRSKRAFHSSFKRDTSPSIIFLRRSATELGQISESLYLT